MAVPSKQDLAKREATRKKLWKGLNDDGSMPAKKLFSAVRTAIRQVWMKHQSKLAFLYDRTIPDFDPNTRTKWLIECDHCKGMFKLTDVEVDHKEGEHTLKEWTDVIPFLRSILDVKHDDLAILCKECHELKTAMERYGYTEEEAVLFKKVTAWEKANSVAAQKDFLTKKGYHPSDLSNKDKRRECYKDYINTLEK